MIRSLVLCLMAAAGAVVPNRQIRSGCRMNPVFSEGVVLQRDRPVRIWGAAKQIPIFVVFNIPAFGKFILVRQ